MKKAFFLVGIVLVVGYFFLNFQSAEGLIGKQEQKESTSLSGAAKAFEPKQETSPAVGASNVAASPSPVSHQELRTFQRFAEAALKRLPTVLELQNLPARQRHFSPPALIQAASAIGAVEEKLKAKPGLAEETQKFYSQCIQNVELAKQVRALCLRYSWAVEKQHGVPPPKDVLASDIKELTELAARL